MVTWLICSGAVQMQVLLTLKNLPPAVHQSVKLGRPNNVRQLLYQVSFGLNLVVIRGRIVTDEYTFSDLKFVLGTAVIVYFTLEV